MPATTASTDLLSQAERYTVSMVLDRNGRVALAPGVEVVRPSRDTEPEVVKIDTRHITPEEAKTLFAGGRTLAKLNARAEHLAEELVPLAADL